MAVGAQGLGKATVGLDLKPVTTPTILHVLMYHMALRKRMVELIKEEMDLDTVLEAAKKDDEILTMSFTTNLATDITTAHCRAMTAPGFSESSTSSPRHALQEPTFAADVVSKNQMKKLRQQLKVEAEIAARRKLSQLSLDNGGGGAPTGGLSKKQRQKANRQAKQSLAIQNGGHGDGGFPRLQGAGGPGGHVKGGGKGDKGERFEGKPFCLNWNRKAPCKAGAICPMAHVCLKCKGPHPKACCPMDH